MPSAACWQVKSIFFRFAFGYRLRRINHVSLRLTTVRMLTMLRQIIFLPAVWLSTSSALLSPCPSQQASLASSAEQYPKPTGGLSSYISSYSSANNGVFSNCDDFTGDMPATLSGPYQNWVTEVSSWSASLESTISAAHSTCLALVVNIVVATPLCKAVADGATTPSATGSSAALSASASSTGGGSTQDSASSSLFAASDVTLSLVMVASLGAVGALTLLL